MWYNFIYERKFFMRKKLFWAFIIPIGVILFVFLLCGIYPFGDTTIVAIDSNTQYVAFVSYLKSIFLGINDFKYTFSATLGENFIPLLGYYLMSPLNLICLLFDIKNMKIAMTLIILLKLGLCGLSMEYYLQKKYFGKFTLLFSICYALMSYNIIYMYHIMWFDSIILFPLVILGIDYIFEDKKPFLYIISLGLAIIFNYYIGITICIGSLIYFVYKFILEYKKINKFKVFVNYGVSSLLGGLVSCFVLLPSLVGISSSKASFDLSSLSFGINISYLKVIAKMFTASSGVGETWHGGPMIGCGMVVLVLVILYFFNKNFELRKKICSFILLLFMMSTFVISSLDLLFHGLNIPNCFDYRHAFIMVFFMIMLASEELMNFNVDKKYMKYSLFGIGIVSLIIYLKRYKFIVSTYGVTILLSFILVLIIFYVLWKKKISYKALFIITIIDLCINSFAYVLTIKLSDNQSISHYSNYVSVMENISDELKEYDKGFYRVEKTFDRESNRNMLAINDSMIFDYAGISHFDSTSRKDVELFLQKLGYRRLLSRSFYNESGGTLAGDMLLGVKYVMSYEQYKNYSKVIDSDINVYENTYSLSIGYAIVNDEVDLNDDPFGNLNKIVSSFSGYDEDIYLKSDYALYMDDNLVRYVIDVKSNDDLYLYFNPGEDIQDSFYNLKMYINGNYVGEYFSKYNWGVIDLGNYDIGKVIEVSFEFNDAINYDDVYFYYENDEVINKHYEILSKNQVSLNKISSSYLVGNISLDDDMKVLFSIPYDEGWKIFVDDVECEVDASIGVFSSINLKEGTHKIELKYTPMYLNIGIFISLFVLVMISVYLIFYDKIWKIYYKYKEICNYIIVGALTTMVSLVSYFVFSRLMDINNNVYFVIANTLSWILSVLFAYVTNKMFVFNSKSKGKDAKREFVKFVSSRILTYVIDLLVMLILVKVIKFNNDIAKLVVQVIVFILNYIFSKLLVFKK